MDESLAEFVKSVDIRSCRVSNTPHLIFLCGGIAPHSPEGPIRSARDYFFRHVKLHAPILLPRIRLAEEINSWFDEDTFADLLELEVYLADSSDLTILFVESPGSIAELGAFATEELLRPRTLAILNSRHEDKRTFIVDGPVRRLKKCDENLVRYFYWNDEKPEDPLNRGPFEDMSKELVQYVIERTAAAPKERSLDKSSNGHTMFLIADLIDIVGITTATEIIECLSLWEYGVDNKRLQKYLFLLEHLKLIKRKLYSNQIYYLSGGASPLIRYDFTDNAKTTDRERIKTLLRGALLKKDPRRMRVYKNELSTASKGRQRHV
jgi:hypothetical protein